MHMQAAESLIISSAHAVAGFFRKRGPQGFRGFCRDTLDEGGARPLSTGGTNVAAELWSLSTRLSYLQAVLGEEPLAALVSQRLGATAWLAANSNNISLTDTFGSINPLVASHIAYQLAHYEVPTDRGTAFGI